MDPPVTASATGTGAQILEALKGVPWLASLGPDALAHVAREARPAAFAEGRTILAELEAGDDLYLIVSGRARVAVIAAGGRKKEIGTLGPGDACGEVSVLTRDLRSATVIATEPVYALRLERSDFEHLLASHPTIAVHFARLLATRLQESDAALDAVVAATEWTDDPSASHPALEKLESYTPAANPAQATIGRAWRELVISHRRELPFLALAALLAVLFLARVAVGALSLKGDSLFVALRAGYTGGIAMVFVSTAAALLRFRSKVQRALAVVFGAGFALILNGLSVFLAFDTFYLDMTTRDPRMVFSVEKLYERTESEWAIALMVALLVLLTYLRHFLRRSAYVLLGRLRRQKAG